MKLNSGLNNAWTTPIYKTSIDLDTCKELSFDILTKENIGIPQPDWDTNLIECIPLLKKVATEKFSDFFTDVYDLDLSEFKFKLNAWLTGSRYGYNMSTHNHSGSHFVSIIYVMAEESNSGGEIILQDPRANANRGYLNPFIKDFSPIEFVPKTGDMLIFPSYVYHSVNIYRSKLRLAIPVDILFML